MACMAAIPARADTPLLLGMLEDPQCYDEIVCDYGRDKACMAARTRKVRLLFAHKADGWTALDSRSAAEEFDLDNLPWTIAFDGRNLGPVRTTGPGFESDHAWTYSRDFLLALMPGQSLPEITNREGKFGGWCAVPDYRPLVLVSAANFHDPRKWKPFKPGDGYLENLFGDITTVMNGASNCTAEEVAAEYTIAKFSLAKSYRDQAGRELVQVEVADADMNRCELEGYPFLRFLTFLRNGDDTRLLGGELQLIDAGDYDNDGKSEVMFWYSGYNRDGYVLYYDDFRRRADYLWGYH